jgi:hypothetical protein
MIQGCAASRKMPSGKSELRVAVGYDELVVTPPGIDLLGDLVQARQVSAAAGQAHAGNRRSTHTYDRR